MTPETKARQQIDQKLERAGWVIQDMKQLNLGAAVGVAVCEYPTDTGPADYVLFVNRNAVGVIEAKKDTAGENLTVTESANRALRQCHAQMAQGQHPAALSFRGYRPDHPIHRWYRLGAAFARNQYYAKRRRPLVLH